MSWSPRCCRSGKSGASRAARICSRDHRGPCTRLCGDGLVTVFSPVGLDENAIDLFKVHDAGVRSKYSSEAINLLGAKALVGKLPRFTDTWQGSDNGGKQVGRECVSALLEWL